MKVFSRGRRPCLPDAAVVVFSNTVINTPFPPRSEFDSIRNMTHTDLLWESLEVYVNTGFVALRKDDLNIPPSDVFPWDTSEEVYVLSAFHLLHCLVRVTQFQLMQMMLTVIVHHLHYSSSVSNSRVNRVRPLTWDALPRCASRGGDLCCRRHSVCLKWRDNHGERRVGYHADSTMSELAGAGGLRGREFSML